MRRKAGLLTEGFAEGFRGPAVPGRNLREQEASRHSQPEESSVTADLEISGRTDAAERSQDGNFHVKRAGNGVAGGETRVFERRREREVGNSFVER